MGSEPGVLQDSQHTALGKLHSTPSRVMIAVACRVYTVLLLGHSVPCLALPDVLQQHVDIIACRTAPHPASSNSANLTCLFLTIPKKVQPNSRSLMASLQNVVSSDNAACRMLHAMSPVSSLAGLHHTLPSL